MAQRLRGLIPLLLDGAAAEPMVDGVRLYPADRTRRQAAARRTRAARGPRVPTAGIQIDHDLTYVAD